jgi:hypothetical protein
MNVIPISKQALIQRRSVSLLPERLGLAGALAGLGGGLAMTIVAALLTRALDQDL